MSSILKRAHRVLLITVAALFVTTLLSPLASLANTDFSVNDQAIIANPNGTGANLRSDPSLSDDTIVAELPQGAAVTILDTALPTDTGIWIWVASDYGNGYVEASLMAPAEANLAETADAPAEDDTAESPATSFLPWTEPIDTGFIVDNNNILAEEGLACRATATLDGEIIAFIPVNETLEVVEPRIHDGEQTFVHINCAGVSGFVDGDFITLLSEQATEPEAEAPVAEAPVVPEDIGAEEPVAPEETEVDETDTGEAPVQDPVDEVEEPVDTELPVDETDDTADIEEPTEAETPVDETGAADVEAPAEAETPVDETDDAVDTEDPIETETPVDEPEEPATDDVADLEDEVAPEDDATEATPTEEVTEEPVETEEPAETETPDVTEEPAETETPDATEDEVEDADEADTDPVTDATPEEEQAEQEPVEEPKTPATTAPAFDIGTMIGSATVTGTNGDGLRCRVAPSDDAATLMVLSEGTKVYVFAEAVDGYLGIDCGGLQGFANVNYLWSGGAGDEEIQKSDMKLVVTGTGNGLNCRTGAGTNHPVITVLRDGQSVTSRGKAANGWVAVVCGGQNGFVATPWVEVGSGGSGKTDSSSGSSSTTGTATVSNTNGDGLYCRTGAGTSYSAITILSPGQSVSVRGAKQGAWVPVSCGGQNGFAHGDFLSISSGSGSTTPAKPSNPGASTGSFTVANTGGQGLNCRAGAGTSHGVITVLRPGQTIDARSGSTNGWQAVICGGQNGFVSGEFVTANGGSAKPADPKPADPKPSNPGGETGQTATVVNTNGDGLYCRTGAGSGNSVITVLSPGQTVPVRSGSSNGWVPVTCGGKAGWASGDYLSIGNGSGSTKPADPKPETPKPTGLANGDHAEVTAVLNLRYEPSLGAGIATSAPAGTVVLITGGASNGFHPVDWDGLKGYMSADYLTKTNKDLSKRGGSAKPEPSTPPTNGGGSATGNAMVDYAMRYLGYPYVWATHGPSSFDCSGFTYWVTKNVMGKDIGAGTWTQVSAGTRVSRSDLQPGDLVFFQNTYTTGLSHVGIYIGGDQFIHAENENTGVVISSLSSNYYGSRWYGAVRL